MIPVFITGTGTDIGKTIVSIIISNALQADYWKPVQVGDIGGTDKEQVRQFIGANNKCLPEVYHLSIPASPHIAARHEQTEIDLNRINEYFQEVKKNYSDSDYVVIEGAGGLLVPLNEREFVIDLILTLKAKVILVSRNYLGSINHSLLTAEVCRQRGVDVLGWVFNDEYMHYEEEIADWSGYPIIARIPKLENISREILSIQASLIRENLLRILEQVP
ncbi:MAG: dethiobiotin synthase [Chitinophagaceae bacterium]